MGIPEQHGHVYLVDFFPFKFANIINCYVRNNMMLEDSFLRVEIEDEDGQWRTVAVDSGTHTSCRGLYFPVRRGVK